MRGAAGELRDHPRGAMNGPDTIERPDWRYSNRFFLVLSWILTEKTFSALHKSWLDGEYNAGALVVVYSIDLLLLYMQRQDPSGTPPM